MLWTENKIVTNIDQNEAFGNKPDIQAGQIEFEYHRLSGLSSASKKIQQYISCTFPG